MKKFLVCLCCFIAVCSTAWCRVLATTDYQVHIAVVCDDRNKGQELIKSLCQCKSEIVYPSDSKFTTEKNEYEDVTVISDRNFDINYHVEFHYMNSKSLSYEILKTCSGAVVLYDIADPTLDPIVHSATFYPDDLKRLLSSSGNAPLTKYIVGLQYGSCWAVRCFNALLGCCGLYGYGWYNAISFATYNGDQLDPEVYKKRHAKLNDFTCELEGYYGIDNKWNRGHPDLSSEYVYRKTLYWIAGQAKRSIRSGFVKGDYTPTYETAYQTYDPPLFIR